MSKFLALSLVIIFFIAGLGIGYVLTPGYKLEETMAEDLGTADKYLDLRYINAMAAHHKGAINLGEQLKENTKRPELFTLANNILEGEPKLIKQLEEWKIAWFNDTSEIKAGETPNLGEYDVKFDLRFLNAIIAHHEAGIEMADEALHKSSRNEILNDADGVKTFLMNSIDDLKQMRLKWYNI
jgi:hypothetical protein